MKQPSVTILLTVKNNAGTINECMEALLNQNYSGYGIYVTDAYSDDGTFELLKKFEKKIKLEQIHGNMAAAYNHMIKSVKTDLIAFIDGDAVADKNWLKTLVESFEPGVVAVGGKPRTPATENKLQEMIGKELEYRFDQLPRYVSRLPTMNLCVRTEAIRHIKFDERLDVVQETEWGYRLTKLGKMVYEPKAIVWHHHRATWEAYFKQQYHLGQNVPTVYLSKEHGNRISGDEISNPWPAVLLGFVGLFFLLSIPFRFFNNLFYITFIIALVSYLFRSFNITRNVPDAIYLSVVLFVRELAWILGVLTGLPRVFK